jgi:ATP-dependent HslUV protease ATP-binding subunit HslU
MTLFMSLPIEDLTPRQIVAELDKYIVGQAAAKRAVAIALRNRYRRQRLPESERDDVVPKNILMMGPTGVGKTEIARRLAQLARAPFVKVEATKFTEVGYVGRDVESMVRDLVANAVRLVEKERIEVVWPEAEAATYAQLAELIADATETPDDSSTEQEDDYHWPEVKPRDLPSIEDVKAGKFDDVEVEFDTEEANPQFLQVFGPQGMEEMGLDMAGMNPLGGSRWTRRKLTVREAREVLLEQQAQKLLDKTSLHRDAVNRTEQTGIIFLDEIDKVAGQSGGSGPDVSREGVQRDLLPIIEGSTVATKFGPVRTDHILFIAAGAFHMSKPQDLIPELQGRLPIRVELEPLREDDFRRILLEPRNALTKQYTKLLAVDGVTIEFTEDGLREVAHAAWEINERTDNIGARRLHTVMERLLEDVAFEAPESETKHYIFSSGTVKAKLGPLMSADRTGLM